MQSTNRFRRQVVKVLVSAVLITIMSLLLTSVSFADPPAWDSWDYRLLGPLNSTLDPDTVDPNDPDSGLTMVILGSGSFVTSDGTNGTVDGGGSYTIYNANGDAVGSGDWDAITFGSFEVHSPGNSPGQGGRLELTALFYNGEGQGHLGHGPRENGSQHDMVIQCSMWMDPQEPLPPGYPWDADFVHAGPYTQDVFGAVMFNLNNN